MRTNCRGMSSLLSILLVLTPLAVMTAGVAENAMPEEDVVEVPAIGQSLCVSNVFQTNMVLQRDKPLRIWGWAAPGEEVVVSFAGERARTEAAADRFWQATLKPVPARSTPQTMMSTEVKTKDDSDGRLLGFAIAGQDRRFYPADIQWYADASVDNRNQPKYQRNVLVLSSRFVSEPIHYRYAWARNPMSNIVNSRGVPLAAQRSDDWILEETLEKIITPENMQDDAAKRYVGNQIRKKLKLADSQRRIQEAEATIAELRPILEKARAERE